MTKDRTYFIYLIGVLTMITVIIGTTIAIFTASINSNKDDIQGNTASLGIKLTVTDLYDEYTENLTPIKNSLIPYAVENSCQHLSDNGEAVCQRYEIVIENISDIAVTLTGSIILSEKTGSKIEDLRWGLVKINDYDLDTVYTYSKSVTDLLSPDTFTANQEHGATITLEPNEKEIIDIVVYIEEKETAQSFNNNYGSFIGTIKISGLDGGIAAKFE